MMTGFQIDILFGLFRPEASHAGQVSCPEALGNIAEALFAVTWNPMTCTGTDQLQERVLEQYTTS